MYVINLNFNTLVTHISFTLSVLTIDFGFQTMMPKENLRGLFTESLILSSVISSRINTTSQTECSSSPH